MFGGRNNHSYGDKLQMMGYSNARKLIKIQFYAYKSVELQE